MTKEIFELIQTLNKANTISNILRYKWLWNKIFWLAFLILSLTGAVYYIVNDLVDYYEYEIVKTEYNQHTSKNAVLKLKKKQKNKN